MVSVSNHPERVEGTRPQTCDFFVFTHFPSVRARPSTLLGVLRQAQDDKKK